MGIITSNALYDAALLTITLGFLYKFFTRNFDYWQSRNVPSIKPLPLIGNFKEVICLQSSIGHFLAKLYKETTTDFFGIWILNTPHLILRSPEIIKHILVKDFNYFHDRTVASDERADPLLSKVLFIVHNPEWKTLRSKLSPLFSSGKIKSMVPLINKASDDMKSYITIKTAVGKSLEAKELCAKFTTDVITSCSFGVEANSFINENAEFRIIGRTMFNFTLQTAIRGVAYFFIPSLVKLFRITFFHPSVNKFCSAAFKETITERERTGHKRNDLIDTIIELKRTGGFEGITFDSNREVAQAIQFFAAGFETSSSTMAFTLYELCLHSDIQLKLRLEINSVLGDNDEISYDAIGEMKYLDKVIKEVLRKYPILPFLDRRCVQDYKLPNSDVVIEKGTPVYISIFGLHYDPQYFPNPEIFDPERFNKENSDKRPAYSYIPFGEGPHNCIGERFGLISSKLGLIKILSNFQVEQNEDTPVPIKFDPKTVFLQSTVGLPMRFIAYNRRVSVAA